MEVHIATPVLEDALSFIQAEHLHSKDIRTAVKGHAVIFLITVASMIADDVHAVKFQDCKALRTIHPRIDLVRTSIL